MTRAPSARHAHLTREAILASALALIERDGLAEFSIRRLGAALGCEPMSLYHYFPSKTRLEDALADGWLSSVDANPPGGDPVGRLRAFARSYLAHARRSPNLFPLIAAHRLDSPAGIRFREQGLALARAAVRDDRRAAHSFQVLHDYLTGAAMRAAQPEWSQGAFEQGLASLLGATDAPTPQLPKPVIHPKR